MARQVCKDNLFAHAQPLLAFEEEGKSYTMELCWLYLKPQIFVLFV